jgi:hypothetical protein
VVPKAAGNFVKISVLKNLSTPAAYGKSFNMALRDFGGFYVASLAAF